MEKKEEAGRLIKEMVDNGIIEESSGPWASPIVLVKKKDGSTRFPVDYRKLNEITIKDSYPLPRIDDTLDALNGSQWFSTLDLKSGYWQVEIQPEDKEKTAFTTGQGLWQFKVMPLGLCNAPATFERLMKTVLHGLTSEACLVYLDDIIIVERTFEEHLNNIRKVFQRLQNANLKLSPKKCRFFRKDISFLGHIISADGVKTDPEKTKATVDYLVQRQYTISEVSLDFAPITVVLEPEGQIARCIQRLQEYDFEIQHCKGTSHGNADALSRRPCKESCKHCTNAEKKFGMETDISLKVLTTEDPWSSSEVRKAQLEDPTISPILETKLNSEDRPSWQEIAPWSPATK
ncbi:Retrovirus-related Pol polyprotein from transposon 297 [Araneus ventricosus]|uniref:Retrovirus-related Pol polyprotein from transposon 297 n=1 Tax=Araneus ventricosus TaxID=182803 RepID=A0A4Y2BL02_ARAVE|nr:Retrovirus-related Pol polyprotein from transposon 297 [Araneus ventricosus]